MIILPEHSNGPGHGGCDCLPRPADHAPDPALSTTTYVLRYSDRWFGFERRLAFEAADVAEALAMMEHEPIGDWAELWQGDDIICRRGGVGDYWAVD